MVKQHLLALTAKTVHETHTRAMLLEGTALNNTFKATCLMVNAALPIDLFVQDLPCWLYTWVQPLQPLPVHSVLTLPECGANYTYTLSLRLFV